MKKALTFIAAVVMLASASFAQTNVLREKADLSYRGAKKTAIARTHQAASKVKKVPMALFTKAAGDTISNFPWEEGFEDSTSYVGWTFNTYNLTSETGMFVDQYASYAHTGSGYIFCDYTDETESANQWAITPVIALTSNQALSLSWYVYTNVWGTTESTYEVRLSTGAADTGSFSTVLYSETSGTQTYVKHSVSLANYAGQNVRIAFVNRSGADCNSMFFDDIKIGLDGLPEVTLNGYSIAFVGDSTLFVADTLNVTTLDWTIDGTSVTGTDTLYYVFTAAGTYNVKVEATNALGTAADSILVDVIDCSAITEFPYLLDADVDSMLYCVKIIDADGDGNNWSLSSGYGRESSNAFSSASYASGALTPDNWMMLPAMELPTTATDFVLSWYDKARSANYPNDYYSVYICTTGNDTSDFLVTTPVYSDTTPTDWAKHGISLANFAGQTIYIAFRHYNCTDQWAMLLDDIRVGGPEFPEVSVNGPETVRINEPYTFTASSDVTPVIWIVDGDTLTETGLTMTYTFTTTGSHTVIVSATNNIGTTSDTLELNAIECVAQTLPFHPAVDAEGSLGLCWDINPEDGWYTGTLNGELAFASDATLYGLFSLDPDNWLVTPMLTMPESGDYQVQYNVWGYGDYYTLYLIQNGDTNALFSETLPGAEDLEPRVVLLPATLTGNFKLALRHHNSENGNQLIIAGFAVDAQGAPIVILNGPTSIAAGDQATYTAISGNATSYSWTVNGAAQSSTTNTLTYTFSTTGNYTIAVTATNSLGSTPVSMVTNVYDCNQPITTLPWEEGFEGNTDCWIFNTQDAGSNGFSIATNGQYTYTTMGNSCLVGTYSDDVTVDQWAISMPFTLPASATDATLSWYVYMPGWQGIPNSYEVRIAEGTNTNPDYFNTVLKSETDSTPGAYVQRSVSLANYAGKTFRIAFHHTTAQGGNSTYFDDIKISSNNAGIDNVNNINVSIYPNPVSDKLNVEGEGIQMVEMFDLNGRSVLTSLRAGQIDLSNLSEGVYVVRVIAADGVRTEKIVKK